MTPGCVCAWVCVCIHYFSPFQTSFIGPLARKGTKSQPSALIKGTHGWAESVLLVEDPTESIRREAGDNRKKSIDPFSDVYFSKQQQVEQPHTQSCPLNSSWLNSSRKLPKTKAYLALCLQTPVRNYRWRGFCRIWRPVDWLGVTRTELEEFHLLWWHLVENRGDIIPSTCV